MAHILIIDDELQIQLMLRKLFESEGYKVTGASDGNEGIRLYRENPADLIITDFIMPEKEGIETIRDLKKEFPEVEIIAISGGGRGSPEVYLGFAKNMGAKYTFAKPINPTTQLIPKSI